MTTTDTQAAHGDTRTQQSASLIHCSGCKNTWAGRAVCHCAAVAGQKNHRKGTPKT